MSFKTKTLITLAITILAALNNSPSGNGATLAILLAGAWWVCEYDKHRRKNIAEAPHGRRGRPHR